MNTDNRCEHSVMWGDRTDVLHRHGVPLCPLCAGRPRCDTHPESPTTILAVDVNDGATLAMCWQCEPRRW